MAFLKRKQQAQFLLKIGQKIIAAPLTNTGFTTIYRVDNAFSVPILTTIARSTSTIEVGPYDSEISIRILASTDEVEYNVYHHVNGSSSGTGNTTTNFASTVGISDAVQDELDKKQDLSHKGQSNGYAPLDASGKVPSNFLPTVFTNGGDDIHFEHVQSSASANWTINHGLNKFPAISIVDSAGDMVEGSVNYVNSNTLIITFSAAFAGKAYLN